MVKAIAAGALLAMLMGAAAAAQESRPNEIVSIPGTDLKFEMVYVPGGKAKLGGEKPGETPSHEAELKPFWMSKNEVTWEAFVKYFENRKATKVDGVTRPSPPYEPPHGTMGVGQHPAVGMRWHGAIGYAEWVSTLSGQRFRLPTEAEFEYAARAGSAAAGPEKPDEFYWIKENAGAKTHLTGTKKPNAFGLCDLMGNVWEYAVEFHSGTDYRPVLRGGGWNTPAADLRFAARQEIRPEWFERDPNRPRSMWWLTDGPFVGFRLVRFAEPAGAAAAKVEVTGLKATEAGKGFSRVTGQIKNTGDRVLDEVELTVFWTEDDGKPVLEDGKARASFSKAYPVIVNSDRAGEQRLPLKPGETRAFALDLPQALETDNELTKLGARVSALQFSKN